MKLLDICCGGGLAAAGYWQSGCFSEIVGVDDNPDMAYPYPFDFVCSDMLSLTYDFLLQFDFIHASPPCQFYSSATPPWARDRHERLIPQTRLMLHSSGLPYVIENVPGSGHDLRPNLKLDGLDVGVPMKRRRYFRVAHEKMSIDEISQVSDVEPSQMSGAGNSHMRIANAANMKISPGVNFQEVISPHGDEYVSRDELIEAFGLASLPTHHLRRLTIDHIKEGIPPAMTKHIALSLLPKLMIA